jgi:predicted DNA-binding helix-hairpin-helix protein
LLLFLVPRPLSAGQNFLVDINSASFSALMQVHGMTDVWSNRIISFRPYSRKTALLERGIVSREEYTRIQDQIVAHRVHHP